MPLKPPPGRLQRRPGSEDAPTSARSLEAPSASSVSSAASRPTTTSIGRRAEDVVAEYLFVHGFRIIGRNVRAGRWEVDLVARRGPLVVLVEVRTRGASAFERPLASITREKQRRMLLAADRLWRDQLRGLEGVLRVRLDVAAVRVDARGYTVEYIPGAVAHGL
jgi:putative endonuclease